MNSASRAHGAFPLTPLFTAFICLFPLLAAAAPSEDEAMPLDELVPDCVDAWEKVGEDGLYDRKTIFKYMDGAGEVYLSFAFRQLLVRQFAREGEAGLTVELYDMGRSAEAYGIFTRNITGDNVGVGQGSEYRSGYLVFWQDRYFATVYTQQETALSRQAVFELSRQIAARIPCKGSLPDLVRLLPAADLITGSIHYFHKHTDLNQHYFLADDNILALDLESEVVLANYAGAEDLVFLMIVRYPARDRAATAYENYVTHFMPEAKKRGITQVEDGYWTATARSGEYIVAVYDAPSHQRAAQLLAAARQRVENRD
jgi:hypothetical protein